MESTAESHILHHLLTGIISLFHWTVHTLQAELWCILIRRNWNSLACSHSTFANYDIQGHQCMLSPSADPLCKRRWTDADQDWGSGHSDRAFIPRADNAAFSGSRHQSSWLFSHYSWRPQRSLLATGLTSCQCVNVQSTQLLLLITSLPPILWISAWWFFKVVSWSKGHCFIFMLRSLKVQTMLDHLSTCQFNPCLF